MFCLLLFLFIQNHYSYTSEVDTLYKWPTVGITVLVRNKAHTLPYFFSCIQNLDYPKDRILIWIYSDYNEDNSEELVMKWTNHHEHEYNGIYVTTNHSTGHLHDGEEKATEWSPAHFNHVIMLREKALKFARSMWADYLFMLDADVFLTNPSALKKLVQKDVTVVAPMLISDGLYSNFWCGMSDSYYYERTEDYKPILSREKEGCFQVPMVHSAVLVSLRRTESDLLIYQPGKIANYDGPVDDIIAFAVNSRNNGISLHICNDEFYGMVPVPLQEKDDLEDDFDQLLNLKLEAISQGHPIPLDTLFEDDVKFPQPGKLGCDEVYMINLERRSERRKLMQMSFKELGISVKLFKAVDGSNLDLTDLKEVAVTLMPGYEDPYNKRPMKTGEVGCFLSHYYIWQEIVEKHHKISLILEDDIHFVPFFRKKFDLLMEDVKDMDWDLLYVGRKILMTSQEEYASDRSVFPGYSYWTLGYLITERGARKLLDANPLGKMLPVDEFLPIMFDQHPNDTWKSYFPKRDLKALSAAPLLMYPTYYTGQSGYISDTEDSDVIATEHTARNEL